MVHNIPLNGEVFDDLKIAHHKRNGIFVAMGPGIVKGKTIKNAKIADLAPTILHLFGTRIPREMDGRVLTEIFQESAEVGKRKLNYIKEKDIKTGKFVSGIEDEDLVRERLKSLGYLE